MHVIEMTSKEACEHCGELPAVTDEELQRIYDQKMGEKLIALMLERGLISSSEADKLSQINREMNASYLSDLFA